MLRASVYVSAIVALVVACSTTGNEPQTHPTQADREQAEARAPTEPALPAGKALDASENQADSKADSKDSKADSKGLDAKRADAKRADSKEAKDALRAKHRVEGADVVGSTLGPPGRDTPLGVVASFFAAATADDRKAALELMTPTCRERETTWDQSFTRAIFERGKRPKSQTLRSNRDEGTTAEVSVRAIFVDNEGRDDREGMRFKLIQDANVWLITEIR
ncbi:MAG: hypothetical protein ACPG4T_20685 [Nannocystaceae bacterium]